MAPESERATAVCVRCGLPETSELHNMHVITMTKSHHFESTSTEPTLTCSEVVERLPAKEFLKLKRDQWTDLTGYRFAGKPTIDNQACQFAEAYATAILHSWRERRVQELEEALRQLCIVYEDGWESDDPEWDRDAAWKQAEALLANSEQIRKGAKHER